MYHTARMVEYHLFSSPILTTFLSCGCCKSTDKSASCICPLPSCYDQMSNYTWTCLHQHLVQGCPITPFLLSFAKGIQEYPRHLCAGSGGQQREGRKRSSQRSSQRYCFPRGCPEVLQHFTVLPPQPMPAAEPKKKRPGAGCLAAPAPRGPSHMLRLGHLNTFSLNQCDPSAYHNLHRLGTAVSVH